MEREITVIPAKNKTEVRLEKNKVSKIRVAAYCRVSTDRDEQLNSFENQINYYTEYIQRNPLYEMAGIYTDEGISGTNTKKRAGFNNMILDCEKGKIDLIITKSISRFARNTQDCLFYTRKLKNLGIGVIFEKENISTLEATGELMFTILSSLAQEESRNISENCKWGIRSKFKKGIPHINTYKFLGYRKKQNGMLEIDEEQAPIVRRIFKDFLDGINPSEIADNLNKEGIPGVSGKPKWLKVTIEGMLKNEKYKGDMLLQKHYTSNYLTHTQKKNNGEITQYYVENSHPAIISKEEWNAVQQEFERRVRYKEQHHIKQYGYGANAGPFCSKIFCGKCGSLYGKRGHKNREGVYWKCLNRVSSLGADACMNFNLKDDDLRKAFVKVWNKIVMNKEEKYETWNYLAQEGNELERLRARQMQELTEEGKIEESFDEIIKMVLECVIVKENKMLEFHFLDGTIESIRI